MPATSGAPREPLTASFERVRKRLLDLSLRNQLLNFRFPQRSCVRVVDEKIDFVYSRLLSGKTLTFEPVRAEVDDSSEEAVEDLDINSRQSAFKRRQDQAREAAKRLKLNVAYDLEPTVPGQKEPKHVDDKLQTLFLPVDLEAQLRKIAAAARTALEESGSNILYLACGFLEWVERAGDDTKRMAPLLLLPVQLEKFATDQATQTDSFRVRMRQEPLVPNVSLEEKLRQEFNLDLPNRGDELSPEQWLATVARHLATKGSSWSVRHQLVLGTFSFGRLLMWQDLNPERWPKGTPLVERPLIGSVLGGASASPDRATGLSNDEVYDLEDPKTSKDLPPIVVDADSSQHSVLIDAARSQNLVVQGPPGTGKSQTITNLIAGALSRGKTVLFVTQKLAALEVVARRLKNAGLESFCLQLHSHRTQKAEFLDDVRQRLTRKARYAGSVEAAQRADQLKRVLQRYNEAVHQPLAPTNLPPFQLFGRALRARERIAEAPAEVRELRVPAVQSLSLVEIGTLLERAEELDDAGKALLKASSSAATHPWAGVRNTSLDRAEFIQSMKAWRLCVGRACDVLAGIGRKTDTTAALSSQLVQGLAAATQRLPVGSGAVDALMTTSTRPGLDALRSVVKQVESAQASWRGLRARPPATISSERLAEISSRLEASRKILPSNFRVADLAKLVEEVTRLRADIVRAGTLVGTFGRVMNVELPTTLDVLIAISGLIESVQRLSGDALRLRTPSLLRRGARERLLAASMHLETLQARSRELSEKFLADLQPEDAPLKEHHRAVASSSWYSWFFADYRAARRAFVAMAPAAPRSRAAMLEAFSSLISFRAELRDFDGDTALRELLEERLKGLKTPVTAAIEAQAWLVATRDRLACLGDRGTQLVDHLARGDEQVIELLAAMSSREPEAMAAAGRAANTLSSRPYLAGSARDLSAFIQWLEHTGKELDELRLSIGELSALEDETLEALGHRASLTQDVMRAVEQVARHPLVNAAGDAAAVLSLNLTNLRAALATAEQTWASGLPDMLCEWTLARDPLSRLSWLRAQGHQLGVVSTQLVAAAEKACAVGGMTGPPWRPRKTADDLATLMKALDIALSHEPELNDWLWYLRAHQAMSRHAAAAPVIKVMEGDPSLNGRDMAEAAIFQTLAEHALGERNALHQFRSESHERARSDYASADIDSLKVAQAKLATDLLGRPIDVGVGSGPVKEFSGLNLIKHELEKQRAHLPIRALMARAGKALQQLMPCFMMGPQSVAQYLPAEALTFDLVIMDEASQMRPEDALGTMARGRQAIIVGDPRQLPPTSFFDTQLEDGDEEIVVDDGPRPIGRTVLESAESILEAASTCFPTRMLQWHYRSKHHSLIEYCNHRFYDGRLVVFPSPEDTEAGRGVIFEPVAGAIYKSGSRINKVEAERVAAAVAEHAQNRPDRSLVVVTLNTTQREVIEQLVMDAAKRNPRLAKFIEASDERNEPFTVKNLENVQGDERDDVFISLTFGKDETGRLVQNFGPINQSNGHRRLNVLFTRARHALRVFCSFDPGMLRVGDGSPAGLQVLAQYLMHAAKLGPAVDVLPAAKGADSPFELAVAGALRGRGLDVQPQVGVAGYFIDVGIRNPDRPGVFLLGVECDGETYHRAKSARDRDRLRDSVLVSLGWKLHRIWSTDWFRNPPAELEKIVAKVNALKRARPAQHPEPEPTADAYYSYETQLVDDDPRPTAPAAPPPPSPPAAPSHSSPPVAPPRPSPPEMRRDQETIHSILPTMRGASIIELLTAQLTPDILSCPTCGKAGKVELSERGPYLRCSCARRRPVRFTLIRAAVAAFAPTCACGRPSKLIDMGDHSFFGCSTYPVCRNHFDWFEFRRRVEP